MTRQAHGRLVQSKSSRKRNKRQKRGNALNALELAEKQTFEKFRVPQHRLGEVENDVKEYTAGLEVNGRLIKKRKVNDMHDNGDEAVTSFDDDGDASGSDDEGGRWHEGINGSDEDSDIDSDEAFGESDEEQFAHFTSRKSGSSITSTTKRKTRPLNAVDKSNEPKLAADDGGWQDAKVFNESDEEFQGNSDSIVMDDEVDDLGDEAVDLATALEMNLEEERKEAERALRRQSQQKQAKVMPAIDDGEEHENSSSEATTSDVESDLSISDADGVGDHAGLRSFVAGLDSSDLVSSGKPRVRSKTLPAVASSFATGSSKIAVSDLLQYVQDPIQRESLKILQASERNGPEDYKRGIPGKLSAPLAKRQQDKLDRAAAYEKSKDTLNRWVDTVKSNRRAEHISFPLIEPGSLGAKITKKLQNSNLSIPQTDLEMAIQKIMQESGVGVGQGDQLEEREAAFEELQERTKSLEEVREKRAQLRLARELMFREEIRAKRIKKIKSKAYRRVHRKERDKIEAQQRDQLAAAGLLNSDDERERNDKRRAEERMGARHKESKWAKGVKQIGRGAWDDDARLAVSDLARRDEELRKRIEGDDVNEDGLTDSESSWGSDDTDTEGLRLSAKLNSLESVSGPTSNLGSMLFMQRAEAARKAQNDEEIRQMRLAMNEPNTAVSDEAEEDVESNGRQNFGMHKDQKKRNSYPIQSDFEAHLSEDELSGENVSQFLRNPTKPHRALQAQKVNRKSSNPPKTYQHREESATNYTHKKFTVANITTTDKVPVKNIDQSDSYTSPSESEEEIFTPTNAYDAKAALAASIFAGPDDAVDEFSKEKKQIIEEEEDQVVDGSLPGWGNWTGAGVSKHACKGKAKSLTTIKGVAASDRQDAKLDRVIINEKRVKKNGKYLATELPHPFETKQQYERSLRLPMGPEWSTVKHYQDAIKPRILLKQGVVIKPMNKPTA